MPRFLARATTGVLAVGLASTIGSAQLIEKQTSTRDYLEKMDRYFEANLPDTRPETVRGTGWKPFNRYKWFVEQRLGTDLDDLPMGVRWNAWEDLREREANGEPRGTTSWFSMGPTNAAGRCLAIEVRPGDSNTVYAGFASGGIWRTTDGGATWTPLGDELPSLAVGCIEIDADNPDRMWMGTGEGWGNIDAVTGVGILVSTDAGVTWGTTGISTTLGSGLDIYELEYNETTGTLLAAMDGGLWRSTDGGVSFTEVLTSGTWKDVEAVPGTTDEYYAISHQWSDPGVYKSVDDGLTWTHLTTGLPTSFGNCRLATTPADPAILFVGIANPANGTTLGIYRSTDAGATFALRSSSDHYNGQGWYNLSIAVDPQDPLRVFSGGVNFFKSTNGGSSFSGSGGGVHVDHHATAWDPNNPDTFWIGSDGGVYRSINSGDTYVSRNAGLVTLQFYAGNHSWPDLTRAYGGTQDNGTWRYSGSSSFAQILGADGFECETGYTDVNLVFAEIQNGEHYRSTNGGSGMVPINSGITESGPWQTPTHLDYGNDNTIFTAHNTRIFRSTNRGTNWTTVFNPTGFGGGRAFHQSFRNLDDIVCVTGAKIFYSTDRGTTWQETATRPTTANTITDVAVHPDDPNTMIITLGTYSGTISHVQKTTDRGATWIDVDDTVGTEAAQAIAVDFDNPDTWFLGTDLAVYVSFDTGNTWQLLNTGLPHVVCDDLRWHPDGYLRVFTHGRGLWELDISDLGPVDVPENGPSIQPLTLRVHGNPTSDHALLRFGLRQAGNARIGLYDAGGRLVRSVLDEHREGIVDAVQLDVRDLATGVYFARLEANGAEVSQKIVVER